MLTLCTLFDHNYLDKGLTMYESLERVCNDFELYILAMSDKCYEILIELNYPHIKPIKLVDFEDEELLRVKQTRKVGEYCWTCSSSLIRYILKTYNPDYCTYIDADLLFYSDPKVIIDEMIERNASVQVIGHRFNKSEQAKREWEVGKYCVEFNTFKNDKNGLDLLEIWRNQCLERCSAEIDGSCWGDQKYLDHWCEDYPFCIETQHLGAGVGPWNINQYKLVSGSPSTNNLKVKCKGNIYPMCFYHFENIEYIDQNRIRINVYCRWGLDDKLVQSLYTHYLHLVDKQKKFLKEQFNIEVLIKGHPVIPKRGKKINLLKKALKFLLPQNLHIFLATVLPSNLFKKKDIIKI